MSDRDHALPVLPAPLRTRACADCFRFQKLDAEQVGRALGDLAHIPDLRAGLRGTTGYGYCTLQREIRPAEDTCEHAAGRRTQLRRWWRMKVLRRPDPDAPIADRIAADRKAAEEARLVARFQAAAAVQREPGCPVCSREHPTCAICGHRRPTCGVCGVCGREGVVVVRGFAHVTDGGSKTTAATTWRCTVDPRHAGIGLPESPPYAGGLCDGCHGVLRQAHADATLEDAARTAVREAGLTWSAAVWDPWLKTRPPGGIDFQNLVEHVRNSIVVG